MTASVQVRIDVLGNDYLPHTFLAVVHPDGSITEYGLVPRGETLTERISGPGRIDITGDGIMPTHEYQYAGDVQPLTQQQYEQLMTRINQSITNPPDYILPGSWWPGDGTNCTGWALDALGGAGLPTQFGVTSSGTWNPYGQAIGQAVNDWWNAARSWTPPRGDPLALDLDRDGIETIGANGTVLFDHDGDGVKTGTGWVSADDGLLVLDRNGNGQIDAGAELFGVDTVLANGQKASDGFAALRDFDANGDGVFDAQDARFADVRVWRDLNQNGASQAGELFTLQTLGITAINLNATAETVNLGNGNVQTATATYVLTDGTTGTTAGVGLGQTAANLEFALNPFYRQFTDSVPLTEQARLLPQMQGSGRVRDLREAANDVAWREAA